METIMDTATVSIFDDARLIRDGETAVDQYNQSRDNARKQILPMALGLLAAKRKYPSTQDFGDWLQTSCYREIGQTDRAALIKIGEQANYSAKFIRTTSLISPELIWDAIQELLETSDHRKSVPVSVIPQQPAITIVETPKNENLPPVDAEILEVESKAGRHSVLSALPRGKQIASLFHVQKTRSLIGKICKGKTNSSGYKILELIHLSIDAGLLTENDFGFSTPSLCLLFPKCPKNYANRFDLTRTDHRKLIADTILPAMIACRDQLLTTPENIAAILADYEQRQRQETVAEKLAVQREKAVATLKAGECEIVMFGKTLWPRLDDLQGEYDYDQLRAAVWTFKDWNTWNQQIVADNGVNSRAIRIRLSTKWCSEYLIRHGRDNPVRKIILLIQLISRLMETAPEAECRWPPHPTSEAEW
jgi:hypothetical protein